MDTATTSSGAGAAQAAPQRCGMLKPLPASWNNATLPPPIRQAQAVSKARGLARPGHARACSDETRSGVALAAVSRRWCVDGPAEPAPQLQRALRGRPQKHRLAADRRPVVSAGLPELRRARNSRRGAVRHAAPLRRRLCRCGRCCAQRLGGERRARRRSARAQARRRGVDNEHRPRRRGSVPRAAKACGPRRIEWERPERRYGCSRAFELRGRGDAGEVPRDCRGSTHAGVHRRRAAGASRG